MAPRLAVWLVAAWLAAAAARPVRRTLSFNMFVLRPGAPERSVLATDGVSRLGPVLEYLVQRVQGLLSVRLPPDAGPYSAPDDTQQAQHGRLPGVVLRPSKTKPGTYDVEIDVLVDDGKPDKTQ